jgi:hypothetical protein
MKMKISSKALARATTAGFQTWRSTAEGSLTAIFSFECRFSPLAISAKGKNGHGKFVI